MASSVCLVFEKKVGASQTFLNIKPVASVWQDIIRALFPHVIVWWLSVLSF